jgi:hypothetical protein
MRGVFEERILSGALTSVAAIMVERSNHVYGCEIVDFQRRRGVSFWIEASAAAISRVSMTPMHDSANGISHRQDFNMRGADHV